MPLQAKVTEYDCGITSAGPRSVRQVRAAATGRRCGLRRPSEGGGHRLAAAAVGRRVREYKGHCIKLLSFIETAHVTQAPKTKTEHE